MPVEFRDFSFQVKAKINETTLNWLEETANEVASQAKRNTSTEGWTNGERTSLRDSYSYELNGSKGEAMVGSSLEQAYWEEFGTGSHADTSKNGGREGRKDWWVYIPGREKPANEPESTHYQDETEARSAAAYIKRKYNKDAVATNGRKPNYTLEKAFKSVKPKAVAQLEKKLKEMG